MKIETNEDMLKIVQTAYKKLKASVYYDKTQTPLRDKLVMYENSNDFEDRLKNIAEYLSCVHFGKSSEYSDKLLTVYNSVSFQVLPKSLKETDNKIHSNAEANRVEIDKLQYYISMDVEGYIFGILWILFVGYNVDKGVADKRGIYVNSYGNRIKNGLFNSALELSNSPYLFEPYFQQYESWRDNALDCAKKLMKNDQNAIIITLDFKRFFYSVGVSKDELINLCNDYSDPDYKKIGYELTNIVWNIISVYSEKLRAVDVENLVGERFVLPIGFHPSNILSNYALSKFDDAISDGWNPVYYGRYVDDIIIVDKVEANSKLYEKAMDGEVTSQEVINFCLANCSAWARSFKGGSNRGCNEITLLCKNNNEYYVNHAFNNFKQSNICVQNDKVKIFYFDSKRSEAMLTKFKENLRRNKSEFRFLPEDEAVFLEGDYSQIYSLSEGGSPNKISDYSDIKLNKFNLSKFLGKYSNISKLIDDDKESNFVNDIDKIFDNRTLIENYSVWDKVLAILVNNCQYNAFEKFVIKIIKALKLISVNTINKDNNINVQLEKLIQKSLIDILNSCLHKSTALVGDNKIYDVTKNIIKCLKENNYTDDKILENDLMFKYLFDAYRRAYCYTRMCDKYCVPLCVDGYLANLKSGTISNINLNSFDFSVLKNTYSFDWLSEAENGNVYKFYPYVVSEYDILISKYIQHIATGEQISLSDLKDDYIYDLYIKINFYPSGHYLNKSGKMVHIYECDKFNCLSVGNYKFKSIKVAVANIEVSENCLNNVLEGNADRSFERYNSLALVVNGAIKEKADMLVLPECCVPFEWLGQLSRTCAKNQIAVVTGVEHIKCDSYIYNLTAVILPYEEVVDGVSYKYSYIYFHSKNYFSPNEQMQIISHNYKICNGDSFELFRWNDFYFSVYSCFELTSIKDRAIFEAYADAIIVVEWNADTNYYSNIVEALSRDCHCYCIQVNTSQYGDSRLTQPTKTESKDIVKVKGGINPTVIVGELNIGKLREFQLKGHLLQTHMKDFKPIPAAFDTEVVKKKIDGTIFKK